MRVDGLLKELFPLGHSIQSENGVLSGFGMTGNRDLAVLGTTDHLAIGAQAALSLAGFVLQVVKEKPGCPFLMLVDTQGQLLGQSEELLGINGYFAHLVKCLELARRRGHRLLTLVYAEAVSGGFLCFGLMADEIHALPEAKIRVMNLPAMSRITKLPLEMLQELSNSSPSFAPGAESFFKLGGVQSIWSKPYIEHLNDALARQMTGDNRRAEGLARHGRELAYPVSERVKTGKPG